MIQTPVREKKIGARVNLATSFLFRKVQKYAKLIVIIISVLLVTLLNLARLGNYAAGVNVDLDGDWKMGIILGFQQDQIMGRDVHFTYGPLAQLILSLSALLTRTDSPFDSYAVVSFVLKTISYLGIAIILLLLRRVDWKSTGFVMISYIFMGIGLEYAHLRCLLPVVVVLCYAKVLGINSPRKRLLWAGVVGLGSFALQLITFDMGIYSIAAIGAITAFCIIGFATRYRVWLGSEAEKVITSKDFIFTGLTVLASFGIGNLVLSLVFKLTSSAYQGFLDYQFFDLEMTKSYNNTMGVSWSVSITTTIVLFLVVIFNIFIVLWQMRQRLAFRESILNISFLAIASISIKSALVRSDPSHIVFGFIGMVVFFLISSFVVFKQGTAIKVAWTVLFLSLFVVWPYTSLANARDISDTVDGKQPIFKKIDSALNSQTPLNVIAPAGLPEAVDKSKATVIFPYQTHILIGLNTRALMPTLQTYAFGTIELQQQYVAAMQRAQPNLQVVYGLDDRVSVLLDNVQSITRTPVIFDYIYRNFQVKTPTMFEKGYLLLNGVPEKTDMQAQPLTYQSQKVNQSQMYKLDQTNSCSLLRLTLKMSYSPLTLIGRPAASSIDIWQGTNLLQENIVVPLAVGKPFTTYISLIDLSKFGDVFDTKAVQQKTLSAIQFKPPQTGLFDVLPDVQMQKAECVTFKR